MAAKQTPPRKKGKKQVGGEHQKLKGVKSEKGKKNQERKVGKLRLKRALEKEQEVRKKSRKTKMNTNGRENGRRRVTTEDVLNSITKKTKRQNIRRP